MKKILTFIFIFTLFSCEESSESVVVVQNLTIDQYDFRNMNYSPSVLGVGIVKLEYQNSKIVKRIGGLSLIDPASGYDFGFNENLFEEISYASNLITITHKITSNFPTIYPDLEKITLNSDNKMISKVSEKFGFPTKTKNFIYDSENLLVELKSGDKTTLEGSKNSKFYYNIKKNLDSIVTEKFSLNNLQSKQIETFTKFDFSRNYTKNLFLFDETLYRSLSENNYTEYKSKTFDNFGILISNDFRNYNLKYDINGKVIY